MPKTTRRKQVLIVDANAASAARLRGVLEGLGYRGVAGDIRQAAGLARGLKLSLALVDGALAGPDLDHLTGLLRRAAVPVVVLHPEDDDPPVVEGAAGYLKTPWRTPDLVQTLYRFAGAAV